MRYVLAAFLLVAALGVSPAEEDKRKKNEEPIKVVKLDRKTPVLYEKDIEPILVNKCAFCHSGSIKEGKLDLSSYESLMRGGKNGSAVMPGKGTGSKLVSLSSKAVRPFMPPRSEEALSSEELALITLWIDQGAKAPTGARVVTKVVLKSPAPIVTPVLGVGVSPDKTAVVASRGAQIHVYDAVSGTHVRTLVDKSLKSADGKAVPAAHLSLVESIAYSPDGKYVASGSYQEVKLWDARTGELRKSIPGFAERVVALAFSSNGKLLACGGGAPTQEGELKIIDVATGKTTQDIKANVHSDTVFGVAFSPDDKMIVSGGADKFAKAFDVATGKFLKSFEGHTHHVLGVGFSGDGKQIATGGADNVVKVWDYATGEQVRTINVATKQVTALAFIGRTNDFVVAAGDTQVRTYNTNGSNTRNFGARGDFMYCVAASPDGSVVAAGGQDGVVALYNGKTGALIKAMLPPGAEKVEKKDNKPKK